MQEQKKLIAEFGY